jgi:hypothetical protein
LAWLVAIAAPLQGLDLATHQRPADAGVELDLVAEWPQLAEQRVFFRIVGAGVRRFDFAGSDLISGGTRNRVGGACISGDWLGIASIL